MAERPNSMTKDSKSPTGKVSDNASSYKNMTAGAGGGKGRLQKTSIAKKNKGAPTDGSGGRSSK